jgi:uncharacterized protein
MRSVWRSMNAKMRAAVTLVDWGRLSSAISVLLLACSAEPARAGRDGFEREEPIELVTATGTLHGSLLRPEGAGPYPLALLLSGSGPTDRNGNSSAVAGRNDSLKLLSSGLADRGVATVRFDKRGVGESAGALEREEVLRFETYVEDVVGWLTRLVGDARFSSVSVVGHSEGSLIGVLASKQLAPWRFVSVAGTARRASEGLLEQLRPQLSDALVAETARILASLEAGQLVNDVPSPLASLFRPSAQPYLISWFGYVPAEEIATLEVPALIAQGTTDIQVAVADGEALHAASPDSELLLVDGMNHVLKLVAADNALQSASYQDPSLPVAPALVDAVAEFVR